MNPVRISVLRGVCQIPAYVAHERGLFEEEGVASELNVEPTAWMVPGKLASGESRFAVIPWTRVAASEEHGTPLVLLCGSGCEEAAVVVRKGLALDQVRSVVVPLRGGMKDLTAMALIESLGWKGVEVLRQPSGDGAIISFFGQGADAASMVEPYATMLENMGIGYVARRTGDVWKGAPGCSLCATRESRDRDPETARRVVRGFARGIQWVAEKPAEAADIAAKYIGVNPEFIVHALSRNRPDANAIRNTEAMSQILGLMHRLGYLRSIPREFVDLSFLDEISEARVL